MCSRGFGSRVGGLVRALYKGIFVESVVTVDSYAGIEA